jgi:hypothetical protein
MVVGRNAMAPSFCLVKEGEIKAGGPMVIASMLVMAFPEWVSVCARFAKA